MYGQTDRMMDVDNESGHFLPGPAQPIAPVSQQASSQTPHSPPASSKSAAADSASRRSHHAVQFVLSDYHSAPSSQLVQQMLLRGGCDIPHATSSNSFKPPSAHSKSSGRSTESSTRTLAGNSDNKESQPHHSSLRLQTQQGFCFPLDPDARYPSTVDIVCPRASEGGPPNNAPTATHTNVLAPSLPAFSPCDLDVLSPSRQLLYVLTSQKILPRLSQLPVRTYPLLMFLSFQSEQLEPEDLTRWIKEEGDISTMENESNKSDPTCSKDALMTNICGTLYPLARRYYLNYHISPQLAAPADTFPPLATLRFFADSGRVLTIPAMAMGGMAGIDSTFSSSTNHAVWCNVHSNLAASPTSSVGSPSATANSSRDSATTTPLNTNPTTSSSSSSPAACTCAGLTSIDVGAQVNSVFETLTGWKQSEVRDMFQKEGFRAFFRLITFTSWSTVLPAHVTNLLTGNGQYQGYIELRKKPDPNFPNQSTTIRCVHFTQASAPEKGRTGMIQCFVPLPEHST